MGRSDFPPPVPDHFGVAFDHGYHGARLVRSVTGAARPDSARVNWSRGQPLAPRSSVETTGSPRFLGNPLCTCPGHGPRRDFGAWPFAAPPCCLPRPQLRRLPRKIPFGARSTRPAHSLSTLRSAGRPDATQDSLPAGGQPLPGGSEYPPGSTTRFQGTRSSILLVQAWPGAIRHRIRAAISGRAAKSVTNGSRRACVPRGRCRIAIQPFMPFVPFIRSSRAPRPVASKLTIKSGSWQRRHGPGLVRPAGGHSSPGDGSPPAQ